MQNDFLTMLRKPAIKLGKHTVHRALSFTLKTVLEYVPVDVIFTRIAEPKTPSFTESSVIAPSVGENDVVTGVRPERLTILVAPAAAKVRQAISIQLMPAS